MHLGLHFNPSKSSLQESSAGSLLLCRDSGGCGTLHPSLDSLLATSCSPSVLPDAASLLPKERRFKG